VALFLAYPHTYGGTERQVELLAPALQQRGWAVEILLPAAGIVAERLRAAGLTVTVVEAPPALLVYGRQTRGGRAARAAAALPAYWSRVRGRVRGAQIVHAFTQRGMLLAGPAARLARAQVVWHVGADDPGRLVNQGAARMASAVVAVSRTAARGLPASRVTVVPNAVDPAAFAAPPAATAEDFHVVCAARLTPEKGIDVLVRATAVLRRAVPDLRVLVLGGVQDGHEAYGEQLAHLAGDLGVADAVCFRGFAEQPFRSWSGGRVYVQPSRREGFGLAVAEAMASGLPVVATAVGGIVDVLDGGRAGRLVPPGDAEALAATIAALLEDEPARVERGRAARRRAESEYAWPLLARRLADCYERALAA